MITNTYDMHAKDHPEKMAIVTETEAISYPVWHDVVGRTANWLRSTLCTNKKVGLLLPNGIPFLRVFAGSSMAGAVAIPLDIKWKQRELEQRLLLAKPSIVITIEKVACQYDLTDIKVVLWEDIEAEMRAIAPLIAVENGEEAFFYMGFTSGTTGRPKAFVRSHRSWLKSFSSSLHNLELSSADHVLIPGALIHSHFLYGAMSTLYFGGTVYVLPTFSAGKVLAFTERFPIQVIYAVPTMIEAIAAQNRTVKKDVKIISSGAKWHEASKHKLRQQFERVQIFEFYGASELSFVTYLNEPWNKANPQSVGKVFDGVQVQIRDANGFAVENGVIGKVYVRSPLLFGGYVQPNTDVLQTHQDEQGWVTVDDLGYMDGEGFLYVVGREKNMIISGGENVYPEEIEMVLLAHPKVQATAVIGVEDTYWGQVPVAFIQGEVSKIELKKLCRIGLSTYKHPRKWFFVEEFPYTTSGKIARHGLEKLLEMEVISD